MGYRCEATSVAGFVQQLAVGYVAHGHWFYVTGEIPARKDPRAVDQRLIAKYGVGVSRWTKARRKELGKASVQYLRFGRFFVLLATHGEHPFFAEEGERVRDIRRVPIKFHGYSISYRPKRRKKGSRWGPISWHPSVRIEQGTYRDLKSYLVDLAARRTVEAMQAEFRRLPFEPYAPVRSQLFSILRAVNRKRQAAGLEPVPIAALRLCRRPVRPFAGSELPEAA